MSITTWKGYDRRAADAAINLNYIMCFDLLSRI